MLANGKETCSCRWKNCPRYGQCADCIAHHRQHKKYPLPSCMSKAAKGVKKQADKAAGQAGKGADKTQNY